MQLCKHIHPSISPSTHISSCHSCYRQLPSLYHTSCAASLDKYPAPKHHSLGTLPHPQSTTSYHHTQVINNVTQHPRQPPQARCRSEQTRWRALRHRRQASDSRHNPGARSRKCCSCQCATMGRRCTGMPSLEMGCQGQSTVDADNMRRSP